MAVMETCISMLEKVMEIVVVMIQHRKVVEIIFVGICQHIKVVVMVKIVLVVDTCV